MVLLPLDDTRIWIQRLNTIANMELQRHEQEKRPAWKVPETRLLLRYTIVAHVRRCTKKREVKINYG